MTFDPTKPCTTRDGREVRLFTERMKDGRLVGTFMNGAGDERVYTWNPDGTQGGNVGLLTDLINIPEKHQFYLNVYRHESGSYFVHINSSLSEAIRNAGPGQLACLKIDFEDGEGL